MPLEHDLGRGGDLERHRDAVGELHAPAPQEARELILRERLANGGDRRDEGCRVGPDHRGRGHRLVARAFPAGVVQGAAAVTEPAHQRRVLSRHLHAVDAEVEIIRLRFPRALGHHQRPGDERRRLARPAGLHRQRPEVDLVSPQHHLLARGAGHPLRLPGEHRLQKREHFEGLAHALGGLGVVEEREHLAQGAELAGLPTHRPGDALDRAEQVGEHRHGEARAVVAQHVLEQHGGARFRQKPGLDFRDLELRRDGRGDARKPLVAFEMSYEIAQRCESHGEKSLHGLGRVRRGEFTIS